MKIDFENYHASLTTTESQNQMESWLFLDVVVREGSAILKLLSGKDQSLLIWRDSFLVLNLGFDVLNGVSGFNIQSDCLSSESLDEDLHTSSESED